MPEVLFDGGCGMARSMKCRPAEAWRSMHELPKHLALLAYPLGVAFALGRPAYVCGGSGKVSVSSDQALEFEPGGGGDGGGVFHYSEERVECRGSVCGRLARKINGHFCLTGKTG